MLTALGMRNFSLHNSLQLIAHARNIPHPEKAKTGGEDAWFISSNKRAIGVADGVGGWADHPGANPAKYSRDLMSFCDLFSNLSSLEMLTKAYEKMDPNLLGSTTAIVATLHGDILDILNVGDSGLMIARDGKLIFETRPQQHSFNFPYQLGAHSETTPKDGKQHKIKVKKGDIIVAGSDGLLDNVWAAIIEQEIAKYTGRIPQEAATKISNTLAEMAALNGKNTNFNSPFAAEARRNGYRYNGGKLDDVTVVTAVVDQM